MSVSSLKLSGSEIFVSPTDDPFAADEIIMAAKCDANDDAVAETARLTDSRAVLTEDEMFELNANLNRLLDSLDERPQVSVTYFVPDEKKSGGKYVEKQGVVRIYDSYSQELVFTDKFRINIQDIISIKIQ